MHLGFFQFSHSSTLLGQVTYRCLLLLLTLSVLAGTLTAQSDQATKRAEVKRLFNEGFQLYKRVQRTLWNRLS